MIAKKTPHEPPRGTYKQVADAYGITVQTLRDAAYDYLQSEGCDDDGTEYDTLHAWITRPNTARHKNEPYQKGDDWPI